MIRTHPGAAIATLLLLAACGDVTPAPGPAPPAAAPVPTPAAASETIEILSSGTYRLGEQFLDGNGLNDVFREAGRDVAQPIEEPLVIVAPASMAMADVMPAVFAVLQPPGRVHLTLRVIESGVGRESTIPVMTGCACRAIHFEDGDATPLPHDSTTPYVFLTARAYGDGSIDAYSVSYDADGGLSLPDELPSHLPPGAPSSGEPLDLAALRTWFDALEKAEIVGLLCLDYRDSLPAGRLVDALTRARAALGHRVLLGPNPREPELEEEFQDDWDDE